MAITRPTVLPTWADTGDKTQPTNLEIETGWPVTSIPPSRQRFNWFFFWVANAVRYFSRRGLSDWVLDETYEVGDRCQSLVDGKTYRSKVAANINFEPSVSSTQWERWGFTFSDLWTYLTTGLYGGICPDTGPATVPTLVNPYLEYTSSLGEIWRFVGGVWKVIANHYESATLTAPSSALPGGSNLVLTSVLPRKGKIFVFAYSNVPAATAATHTVVVQISGGAVNTGTRSVATAGVEPISTIGITLNVDTDSRNLLLYAYPALAGAPSHTTYMKYQYID